MNNLIDRQKAILDVESWTAVDEREKYLQKKVIEWLKEFTPAELSTDAISRRAALDICNAAIDFWYGMLGEGALVAIRDKISGLPPISSEPQWIPCSERLPEENETYLACYEDVTVLLDWFFYRTNPAIEETGMVLAWMPLPEPYQKGAKD